MLGDIIPKKKRAKKAADKTAELKKLYAEFEREKKKIDKAVAKFDHAGVRDENKGFYKTFFGITAIVFAASITTFILVSSEAGNVTGAALANLHLSAASVCRSTYFNLVLGGIFGLLMITLAHLLIQRRRLKN